MWIPTPIYERIPQFWLLLGLLFMSCGTLLGFSYALTFAYFSVGFVCCVWSMCIFTMRLRSREVTQQTQQLAESKRAESEQAGSVEQALQAEQHEDRQKIPEMVEVS